MLLLPRPLRLTPTFDSGAQRRAVCATKKKGGGVVKAIVIVLVLAGIAAGA